MSLCDYIIRANAAEILQTRIMQVPTVVSQSWIHIDPVRPLSNLTVSEGHGDAVRATAVSSCGRCASLFAWWFGQWSWSGHPEPHPAVPAPFLPPGPSPSAAAASANMHSFFFEGIKKQSPRRDQLGSKARIKSAQTNGKLVRSVAWWKIY